MKDLNKQEQLSIDEYNSLNSQYVLNCVRAYRYPELTYDYKKEADIKLIKTKMKQISGGVSISE